MGNLATPKSVQKLQTALHAKAKAEAGYRFYALYDKISRDDILAQLFWPRILLMPPISHPRRFMYRRRPNSAGRAAISAPTSASPLAARPGRTRCRTATLTALASRRSRTVRPSPTPPAASMAARSAVITSSLLPPSSLASKARLTRLHQLSGLGDAKLLKSLGRSFKGRHLYGALEVKDCFLRLLLSCLVLDGGRQVGSIVIDPTL